MAKKGFIAEFKEFIARGNVMDLAVGVIIGGAFQSIVNSLVNDMIMPVISLLTGGVNFSNWVIRIGSGENDTINYGNFITAGCMPCRRYFTGNENCCNGRKLLLLSCSS